MNEKKFDPRRLQKLNNPERLKDIPLEYIQGKLNLENPRVLVEIGAGTAFFSKALLELFRASTIYACDLSETMLHWIKENVTPGNPNIIPVKNQESSVPLDSGMADLVFMITLHHELENPLLMLKEAHRLLKPGGAVFIVDWLKKEMNEGPALAIRCLSEEAADQLVQVGFENVQAHEDLNKYFFVVGKKPHQPC